MSLRPPSGQAATKRPRWVLTLSLAGYPVGWFENYMQDSTHARTFYETVFGFALTKREGSGSPAEW